MLRRESDSSTTYSMLLRILRSFPRNMSMCMWYAVAVSCQVQVSGSGSGIPALRLPCLIGPIILLVPVPGASWHRKRERECHDNLKGR